MAVVAVDRLAGPSILCGPAILAAFLLAALPARLLADPPSPARPKSESAQLVTGPSEGLQSAVAGTSPTAILEIVPGPPRIGSYPPGTTIGYECNGGANDGTPCVTNASCLGGVCLGTVSAPVGGFRAWFEYRVSNWDPNHDGTVPDQPGTVQIKLNVQGLEDADTSDLGTSVTDDGDQPDITTPVVACSAGAAGHAQCATTFGESWAKCQLGFCKTSYADKDGDHSESFCIGLTTCNQADCDTSVADHRCFAITGDPRPDDGSNQYFATLVLDIPPGAKGRYLVGLDAVGTRMQPWCCLGTIETAIERGFAINIRTGACCYDFSSPSPTCEDALLESECDARPQPSIWTADASCAVVQFLGRCEPAGACCDRRIADDTLRCRDDVPRSRCLINDPEQVSFHAFTACAELECEEHTGACCDQRIADEASRCRDGIPQSQCPIYDPQQVSWHKSIACADIDCPEHSGACCNEDAFGDCQVLPGSQCACPTCRFHKDTTCADIECIHGAIPTVSAWGLAALSLLLMIGAKVFFGRRVEAEHLLAKAG